jgi:hypothetical protein
VQAIVHHLGRFLYIAVVAPGSQSDVNAFKHCGLHDILSRLPLGYIDIGGQASAAHINYPPMHVHVFILQMV